MRPIAVKVGTGWWSSPGARRRTTPSQAEAMIEFQQIHVGIFWTTVVFVVLVTGLAVAYAIKERKDRR